MEKTFKPFVDMWPSITTMFMTGCSLYHWFTSWLGFHCLLASLCCLWRNLKIRMIHGGEQVDLTQNLSEKELLQNTGRDYVFEHFMIKRYQLSFSLYTKRFIYASYTSFSIHKHKVSLHRILLDQITSDSASFQTFHCIQFQSSYSDY